MVRHTLCISLYNDLCSTAFAYRVIGTIQSHAPREQGFRDIVTCYVKEEVLYVALSLEIDRLVERAYLSCQFYLARFNGCRGTGYYALYGRQLVG